MRVWKNLFGGNGEDKIASEEIFIAPGIMLNKASFPYRHGEANEMDWNDLPHGWYKAYINTSKASNFPANAYNYGALLVFRQDEFSLQLFFEDYGNYNVYWRTKYSTNWRTWKTL